MERKILFVDDDHDVLRVLKALAYGRGFMPCCALSGAEALHIMARDHVRVFCLDLLMPGMNGFELCRRIKEIDFFTCVFALSGYADGHTLDAYQKAGFDGFFGKPIRFMGMFDAFNAAFEKISQWEKQNGGQCGRLAPRSDSRIAGASAVSAPGQADPSSGLIRKDDAGLCNEQGPLLSDS